MYLIQEGVNQGRDEARVYEIQNVRHNHSVRVTLYFKLTKDLNEQRGKDMYKSLACLRDIIQANPSSNLIELIKSELRP